MSEPKLKVEHTGLKCDNPNCDWKDTTITVEDYPNWINKPCPKCGENVLTEEDYKLIMTLSGAFEFLSALTDDQINEMAANINKEDLKNLFDEESFKNLMEAGPDELMNVKISAHKKIKFEDLEKAETTTEQPYVEFDKMSLEDIQS